MSYPFRALEAKWQNYWQSEQSFEVNNLPNSKKSYVLEMFPYPSGKLHMGHVRNYAIGDAIARFKMARGYEVLHPMGWDAFGLPAENAAAQNNVSPKAWTLENIAAMRARFKALGFSFDWQREVASCRSEYYGLEQKIFLDFIKNGLAYRRESWVNWDPVDNCVLANEQVINGRGWRSGAIVEKRKLNQWSLKITDYAQELIDDLQKLQGWPEKVIRMQENWIGRSQGAHIEFSISGRSDKLAVFTTRPETLFGAAFCAIAPTHPIADELAASNPELAAFIEECQRTPTTEEALSTVEKKGFLTSLRIDHPFIAGASLPLYVANFVLMDYGTGAIFACPAHDERDYEFAKKYQLPIIPVVGHEGQPADVSAGAYTGPGAMVNSDFMNGMKVEAARDAAISRLEALGIGQRRITYRLRDWSVSRQRYWGCPIPVVHCDACGVVPVNEADLPIKLPEDVSFAKTGNPLDHHPTWKHTTCPSCKKPAIRETDTLDTFFESSWYFLRFCDPQAVEPINRDAVNKWMSVDWYIGGIEHAVLHLLYARFFTKALRDCGYIAIDEPFQNLLTQGMVCHQTFKDQQGQWLYPDEVMRLSNATYVTIAGEHPVEAGRSEKMSKSKKNIVDPDHIMDTYGADAARLFVLSDNPPERDFDWSEEGVEGSWRYLNRIWRLGNDVSTLQNQGEGDAELTFKLRQKTHQGILKITEAYERNAFNKVIAFCRELTRDIEEAIVHSDISVPAVREATLVLIQSLNPLIPHLASELWTLFHNQNDRQGDITKAPWPEADPVLAAQQEITIAVQVNGKMRGSFTIAKDSSEDELLSLALQMPAVQRDINDRPLLKKIIVPNRIVNIVV